MKWWNKFIEQMPQIPLRTSKEKPTMKTKSRWLDQSVSKSLAMLYQAHINAYGQDSANVYITELLRHGRNKFSDIDIAMVEQKVQELIGEGSY